MLRERDLKIIKHIDKYGFITIKQCYKMFFTDRKCGYDLARRRLSKLVEQNHIKGYMDYLSTNPEKIFYLDDRYIQPTRHTILIMDSYAEIVALGGDVLYFEREQKWVKANRRSDGYCLFLLGGYMYEVFIEVIYHLGVKRDVRVSDMTDKYSDVVESMESKNIIGTVWDNPNVPTNKVVLVVTSNTDKQEISEVDDVKAVSVNYNLKGIGSILI